jgi:hypothetical protein
MSDDSSTWKLRFTGSVPLDGAAAVAVCEAEEASIRTGQPVSL